MYSDENNKLSSRIKTVIISFVIKKINQINIKHYFSFKGFKLSYKKVVFWYYEQTFLTQVYWKHEVNYFEN